jgi:hypothetical protein
VVRGRPSVRAARATLPPHARSTASSEAARAGGADFGSAPSPSARATSQACTSRPAQRIARRSSAFSSSRTLPGQS